MPRASTNVPKPAKKAAVAIVPVSEEKEEAFPEMQDQLEESPTSSETDSPVTKGKKRGSAEMEGVSAPEFGTEMHKMFECFGSDITKTLAAKRKRLEQFTSTAMKTSNKKLDDIWKTQQLQRQKLEGEFKRQIAGVFQQWETDLEGSKTTEEKLQSLFKQQQKLFQQTRIVQTQRLKTIKQLHEQYIKGMEELDDSHQNQQNGVQSELKKEMQLLQKRILMDTQSQEMANVRKSLQTMLF